MEGSTSIRLRAYLEGAGIDQRWLRRELGVARSTFSTWLSGRQPVPAHRRTRILELLNERAEVASYIPADLFEED